MRIFNTTNKSKEFMAGYNAAMEDAAKMFRVISEWNKEHPDGPDITLADLDARMDG